MYNDGHNRPDVKEALNLYNIDTKIDMTREISYTGNLMDVEVPRVNTAEQEIVIYYHDESSCSSNEKSPKRYRKPGVSGRLKDKNPGRSRMVACYMSAKGGICRDSLKMIDVGKEYDGYWTNTHVLQQIPIHLAAHDRDFPGTVARDTYDNSSGHGCFAKDALRVEKMNIYPGGPTKKDEWRQGWYMNGNEKINQNMYFKPGDILLVNCMIEKQHFQANYRIRSNDKLDGKTKGSKQVLKERGFQEKNITSNAPGPNEYASYTCQKEKIKDKHREAVRQARERLKENHSEQNLLALVNLKTTEEISEEVHQQECYCSKCTLKNQDDFKNQKNGLEEVYESYNREHGTHHFFRMLPKFHPELNPIERLWGRMKYFIRKSTTGNMKKLQELMDLGLKESNVDLAMMRRFVRLSKVYLKCYEMGMDLISAEAFIRKHRSHRSVSKTMDESAEKLSKMDPNIREIYFPILPTDGTTASDIEEELLDTPVSPDAEDIIGEDDNNDEEEDEKDEEDEEDEDDEEEYEEVEEDEEAKRNGRKNDHLLEAISKLNIIATPDDIDNIE
jgi:hypothetical protein